MRSLYKNTLNQPRAINCIFFVVILIGFVYQQHIVTTPSASWSTATEINLALHYFPRTPPPIFEPEILDLAQDSTDSYSTSMVF